MSIEKTGGSAFPSHGTMGEVVCEGMTLLDYFAGQALMGLVFAVATNKEFAQYMAKINPDGNAGLAEASYAHAQAMLAEKRKHDG